MEVYIIYMTTYVCKQRVVALLLMELLSKMRKMRTITPPDATHVCIIHRGVASLVHVSACSFAVSQASDLALLVGYVA